VALEGTEFRTAPEFNLEATPLMIGGVLYTTIGARRDSWRSTPPPAKHSGCGGMTKAPAPESTATESPRRVLLVRWQRRRSILYITPGYHLIALSARTGQPVSTFGKDGVVDLYTELDRPAPEDGLIGSSSPPIIVRDTAVVGAALLAFSKTIGNIAVRPGYDVRTGKRSGSSHNSADG